MVGFTSRYFRTLCFFPCCQWRLVLLPNVSVLGALKCWSSVDTTKSMSNQTYYSPLTFPKDYNLPAPLHSRDVPTLMIANRKLIAFSQGVLPWVTWSENDLCTVEALHLILIGILNARSAAKLRSLLNAVWMLEGLLSVLNCFPLSSPYLILHPTSSVRPHWLPEGGISTWGKRLDSDFQLYYYRLTWKKVFVSCIWF